MADTEVSFHPTRDIRRVRVLYASQFALAVINLVVGVILIPTAGDRTALSVIAGVLITLSLLLIVVSVSARRAGVTVDVNGLRWHGIFGSSAIRWRDVQRIVIEDGGRRFGTKVGVTLDLADGARRSVPDDALSGLEDDRHVELKHRVLTTITSYAEQAGVPVTIPQYGDPPIT